MAIASPDLVNPWKSVTVGPDNPFHVTSPSVWYDQEAKDFIVKLLDEYTTFSIEHGPYDYLKTDMKLPKSHFDLYAHTGNVGRHIDNYGDTIGMILLSEGDHVLISHGHEAVLKEGCIFHLDSEIEHETITSMERGRLAFIAFDYGWKNKAPVDLDYNEIAISMCSAIKRAAKES